MNKNSLTREASFRREAKETKESHYSKVHRAANYLGQGDVVNGQIELVVALDLNGTTYFATIYSFFMAE